MKRLLLTLAALSIAFGLSQKAFADVVLYDNGPVNGNVEGWDMSQSGGFLTANSFVISSGATVDGVTFDSWNFPSDTISATDWTISTTALPGTAAGNDPGNTGIVEGSGTAPVTSVFLFSNDFGYDVDQNIITLPNVALTPGTYYLTLSNAAVSGNDPAYWDESDGPSTAYESAVGNLNGFVGPGFSGSETFQILGPGTATPEPSGLLSFGTGAVLVGLFLLRRRAAA